MTSLVQWLIYQYGEVSANYAGYVVRWFDVSIWSTFEDCRQTFVGF